MQSKALDKSVSRRSAKPRLSLTLQHFLLKLVAGYVPYGNHIAILKIMVENIHLSYKHRS